MLRQNSWGGAMVHVISSSYIYINICYAAPSASCLSMLSVSVRGKYEVSSLPDATAYILNEQAYIYMYMVV